MNIIEQINKALTCHSAWKIKLKQSIDNGCTDLDDEEVSKDTICLLGAWLHSNPDIKKHKRYNELLDIHKKFHIESGKIVKLVKENKIEEAKNCLKSNSDYSVASLKLTKLLMSMQ